MKRIHKRPDGGFLFAAAAVMFLAVCAWGGAGLYARLRPSAVPAAQEDAALSGVALTGIALRSESVLRLSGPALPASDSGERIPVGGALARLPDGTVLRAERSCLFFSDFDGLEGLTAPTAEMLSVPAVLALLDAAPAPPEDGCGRLVYAESWYYAALAPADAALPDAGPCRLRFPPLRAWLSARLLAVSEAEDGQRALLFRLEQGGDYLSLRRCEAVLYTPAV